MDELLRKHITDVCLKSEYNNDNHGIVKFWTSKIYWGFTDSCEYNDNDIIIIRKILNELRDLINIEFVYIDDIEDCEDPKVIIHLGSIEEFKKYVTVPEVTGINGYAEWMAKNCIIYKSYVFASNELSDLEKDIILREEIIQCLGFTGETLNEDSIFYKHKDANKIEYYNTLFDIDIYLLRLVYSDRIQPCMNIVNIERVVNGNKNKKIITYIIVLLLVCIVILLR